MSLNKVFSELQVNKSNFLNCKTGDDFEQRIITSLKANGFNHMVKGTNSEIDFFIEKIKLSVLDKLSMIYIKNTTSIKDVVLFKNIEKY
jgi:3-methyladenine DNA glycosylase AlkD